MSWHKETPREQGLAGLKDTLLKSVDVKARTGFNSFENVAKSDKNNITDRMRESQDIFSISEKIKSAMLQAGITPPDSIIIDGKIKRFSIDEKKSKKSGYYVFHNNSDGSIGGMFGNHKTKKEYNFSDRKNKSLTPDEMLFLKNQITEHSEKKKKKNEIAAESCQYIYNSTKPAPEDFPYFEKKKIKPSPDVHVTGEGKNIIIPAHDENNTLNSLQYIDQKGNKKFQSGGAVKGCFHTIGDPAQSQTIYIVEGYATGATVNEATGRAVVIAFSAGNLEPVTKIFKEKDPLKKIIIAADNDKSGAGQEAAITAARKFGVDYIIPPEEGDFNDMMIKGYDIKELLTEKKIKNNQIIFIDETDDFKVSDELVENFLTWESLAVVYGPSNSGKTAFVILLSACLSLRTPFLKREVDPQPAYIHYIAREAPGAVLARFKATEKHTGQKLKNIAIDKTGYNFFTNSTDHLTLIDNIKRTSEQTGINCSLIVADTLSRLSAGAVENSSDMAVVMDRLEEVAKSTGACFLVIHHSGKDISKGSRGHSSIQASADTEIEVSQSGKIHTAKVTKQRSLSGKTDEIHYTLHPVEMGITKFGKPATAVIALDTDEKPKTVKDEKMKSKLLDDKQRIKNAWEYLGCEIRNGSPYITVAGMKKYLIDYEGSPESTAKSYVKPGKKEGVFYNLFQEGIITRIENGYIVTDPDLLSVMVLKNAI